MSQPLVTAHRTSDFQKTTRMNKTWLQKRALVSTSPSCENMTTPELNSVTSNRMFKAQAASQQQSALVQLPFEIRTMILKPLLCSPIQIEYTPTPYQFAHHKSRRRDYIPWQEIREATRPRFKGLLYPAILSTCQTLYRDGSKLLYAENTLAIELDFSIRGHAWWFILGEAASCVLLDRLYYSSVVQQLQAKSSAKPDPWSPHSRWMYGQILTVLVRMQKLHFSVYGTVERLNSGQSREQDPVRVPSVFENVLSTFEEVTRRKLVRFHFYDVPQTYLGTKELEIALAKLQATKLEVEAGYRR